MREAAGIVDTHAEATSVTITRALASLTQGVRGQRLKWAEVEVNIGVIGVGEVHGNDDFVEYCARLLYSDGSSSIALQSLRWPGTRSYSETRSVLATVTDSIPTLRFSRGRP
jgi:hypothetical protein